MDARSTPWYENGLRFACQGCGACCRGQGYVWVDEAAIRRLAGHLGLEIDEFGRRYLRRVGRRWALIDKANLDCIFWDDGCTVYEARPPQCRTFPFWPEQLASRRAWEKAAEECRGIGRGRLYEAEEARRLAEGAGDTDVGPDGGCGCGGCDG